MEPGPAARGGASPARPYRSARRQEQARRTRQRILDAATAEFSSCGYAATTMTAIAAAAGVSVPTVEQVFRTKANLLKTAIDVAIAGDDEPVPVLQRPAAVTAAAAPTAETFLGAISTAVADVAERAAALVLVAFEAAGGDPRLRPLAGQLRDNRAVMAGWIVDELTERTPLRAGIDRSHAVDVLWLLMDPAVFTRLTTDRGWSQQRFRQWFADSIARMVTDHRRLSPQQSFVAIADDAEPDPSVRYSFYVHRTVPRWRLVIAESGPFPERTAREQWQHTRVRAETDTNPDVRAEVQRQGYCLFAISADFDELDRDLRPRRRSES